MSQTYQIVDDEKGQNAPRAGAGLATCSLIFGILSILIFGKFFGILGLIFGALSLESPRRGQAIAGMTCSIIGILSTYVLRWIMLNY